MNVRGVIEGFYGPPWTHAERLDLIRFCGEHGLNTWVHAPKDDPFHRRRWREPYPDAELELFAELGREAQRHGVELTYAIAPGLDIRYSSDSELEVLLVKCRALQDVGIRSFQLLWDDIEHASAEGQASFSNRLARELAQPGPLVVCPTGYAGTGHSSYRDVFGPRLDPDIVVYWTGPEVVSLAITREELDAAVARFHDHELLLWDNYPVNDFATDTLFLGPLRGRDPRLAEGRLRGIVANGMLQAIPSKLALATMADWARDPHGYDPLASFGRALSTHGADVVEALRALATAPATVEPVDGVASLVEALAPGVDAAVGAALLAPFV